MRISDWSSDVCSSDLLGYTTNIFGSAFYTLTGFHGVHVSVGIIMLMSLLVMSLRGNLGPEKAEAVEIVEIGRASCRERVCQYVYISVDAVSLNKKERTQTPQNGVKSITIRTEL